MPDGKLIVTGVVGTLVVGVAIVILTRLLGTGRDAPGRRLRAHLLDRDDYRALVGVPPARPTDWAEVAQVTDASIILRDSRELVLSDVTAYVVAYPGGALVDHHGPRELPLPSWVGGLRPGGASDRDVLTESDLKAGQSLVAVSFGRSTAHPGSRDHYSTTLTNRSGRPVRVLKFAGYSRSGGAFKLHTVTGRFFSAAEFQEWYGQSGGWIDPGQSVTDPNNYGSRPVLWAYYCEADDGQKFVTGAVIE